MRVKTSTKSFGNIYAELEPQDRPLIASLEYEFEDDVTYERGYYILLMKGRYFVLNTLNNTWCDVDSFCNLKQALEFCNSEYNVDDADWNSLNCIPLCFEDSYEWWNNLPHPKKWTKSNHKEIDGFITNYTFQGVRYDWKDYVLSN